MIAAITPGARPPEDGSIKIKICGLREARHIATAAAAGAAYVGFVFVEKSPRFVSDDLARELAVDVPPGVGKVALTVDATDAELDRITRHVPLDFLQLHGKETPERVAEIKARYGLPVIKALGISDAGDVAKIDQYEHIADQMLLDAKPLRAGGLPGGNGIAFDWGLIAGRRWVRPWMLSGGLTIENVALAVAKTGANQVDLSSGVETAPGMKDQGMIRDFIKAAQTTTPKL